MASSGGWWRTPDGLLDLFAEFDVRATFFVLGWIAEREPALVRRIAAAGHEVASHGYWHKLVYDQAPDQFREDVRTAKAALEAIAGQPVLGYRAPSFSITERSLWALDVLAEEGFAYDASIFPVRHDRYGIPSAPRHAFRLGEGVGRAFRPAVGADLQVRPVCLSSRSPPPLSASRGSTSRSLAEATSGCCRMPGRGGASAHVNQAERKPVVFYVHPWELDEEQPRLEASALSTFRHYRNLSKTERRLRRLLVDFRFDSIAASVLGSRSAMHYSNLHCGRSARHGRRAGNRRATR